MRLLPVAAVLALLSLPAWAETPVDAVNAFHRALSHGDAAAAKALLSPNVEIYEAGYVERSRDEYAAHHLQSDIGFASATTSQVLRQHQRIAGDTAIVVSESETTGNYLGRPVQQAGTETVALEKRGEGWRIAHVHWSSHKGKQGH